MTSTGRLTDYGVIIIVIIIIRIIWCVQTILQLTNE